MKIFISSLITGMESLREAAANAVRALGHEPIMAETFGARPTSPQIACLDGLRQAGAIVLIVGERYGAKQDSGLSATHEEFREGSTRCPVFIFRQEGMTPEPDQASFIKELEGWEKGYMRETFSTPATLQTKVTFALHQMDVKAASTPLSVEEILTRALDSFPDERRNQHRSAVLSIVVAGGPSQTILRPSKMEEPALAETLEKEALYGSFRIFERGEPTSGRIIGDKLVLRQEEKDIRLVSIDALGTINIRQPAEEDGKGGLSVIIVETIKARMKTSLLYADWVLGQTDPTHQLTHLVVAASISGGMAMKTKKEQQESPNTFSGFGNEEHPPVHLTPAHIPRAALRQNLDQVIDDLVTLLHRQWRSTY